MYQDKKALVITRAKEIEVFGDVSLTGPRGVAESAGIAHFDKLGATLHSKDKLA